MKKTTHWKKLMTTYENMWKTHANIKKNLWEFEKTHRNIFKKWKETQPEARSQKQQPESAEVRTNTALLGWCYIVIFKTPTENSFVGGYSPHHCVGFLFFAWIPPLSSAAVRRRRPPPRRTHYSLTHSLTHPPTHSLTHSITHSLTHAGAVHRASWRSCGAVAVAGPRLPFAWQAQYTEPPHFPFAWQAQYTELPGGAAARWPPLARGCLLPGRRSTQSLRTSLLRGRRSTQSFLAELRRGGRRWPAAAFCLAGAVHRASALPILRGRRSTQSFLAELRRGGRRWPAAAFCLAGAVHRASALPFCVAGAVHRASWRSCGAVAAAGLRLPFAWRAQYTEPPHFPFAWQAQYTELPGGAAARWPPLARGCLLPGRRSTQSLHTSLLRGRRSTQSFLAELRRGGRRWPAAASCLAGAVHRASALPFCVAGAVHRASWRSCGAVAAAGPRLPFAWQPAVHKHRAWRGRRNTQCSTAHHKSSQLHFWHVHFSSQLITSQLITSQLITVPLLTPHLSQLPYHITTSHHNLSQLIPSQLHFSHPFSHLTYHIRTHHSSTSHTWHHKSTSHISLLTPPRSSH